MRYSFSSFFPFVWLLILASSCSILQPSKSKNSSQTIENQVQYSALFIDAKRAQFAGDFEESTRILNQLLATNPNNDAVLFELSRVYGKINVQMAIGFAEKAIQINPKNNWYLNHIANLYVQKGQYKEAANATEKMIELNPYSLSNYHQLVNIHLKANDLPAVLNTYYQIEQQFGVSEDITLRRKEILLHQKKYSKAAAEMQQLINIQPDNKRYYGLLADIYMASGDEKLALDAYQKVLQLDSNDGKVHMVLSSYYYNKKDYELSFTEMIEAFKSTGLSIDDKIEIMLKMYDISNQYPENQKYKSQVDTILKVLILMHPDDPKAMAMTADFLVKDKKWNEALVAYQKVIEMDSSRYPIWEQIVLISKELNDYQSMQIYSRRALGIFPQYPILYYFNAKALNHLGRFQEAEASLSLGLSFVFKPQQEVEFYTLMGMVRDSLKHYNEASISFERALMADPNNSIALMAYALHLAHLGKEKDKAISLATKALELKVDDIEIITDLAKVYHLVGEFDKATYWINKGLQKNANYQPLLNLQLKIK